MTDRGELAWRAGIALCVAFTVYVAWVHRTALYYGGIDLDLVWYYVHGPQDALWVPYIHPPLYSVFMNTLAWVEGWTSIHPMDQVLLITAGVQVVLIGVAARLRDLLGRGGSLLSAALIALTPSALRPLEQYPVAALLLVAASLLALRAARDPRRANVVLAVLAALAAVEMSLLLWFPLLALAAALAARSELRRGVLLGVGVVAALFLITTLFGFWDILRDTRESTVELQGMSIGWTNPALYVPLALVAWAPVRRALPAALPLALAVGAFTGVVLLLQKLEYADGAGYPNSYRYFSLIDPLLVLTVVAALVGLARVGPRGRVAAMVFAVALLGTQLRAHVEGQQHVFFSERPFAHFAQPWRPPGGAMVPLDPPHSIDVLTFSDARKECMRAECAEPLESMWVEGRGRLTGDFEHLEAMRECLDRACPE